MIIIILIIILAILFYKCKKSKYLENNICLGGSAHLNKKPIPDNKLVMTDKNFNKDTGYTMFSKEIYHNIANHKLDLNKLDLNNKKAIQIKNKKKFTNNKQITTTHSKQHWTLFDNWDKLKNNAAAQKEYIKEKNEIIDNPNLDWSDVINEISPKLEETREYIGIINIKKGTNKLYIKKMEGSPTTSSDEKNATTFASIPSSLVNKYANIVGLFMFHTHPLDIRGSPLPSSYDLSAALYFGSISRFAASIIISRYGVLMYGLSPMGYKFLTKSKDYNLAVLNLSFDIIAAHESIRSWSKWKLEEYVNFYRRYKMFMYVFPSSEYVADNIKYDYEWSLTNPISHELIIDHYEDINSYLKNSRNGFIRP